MSGTAVVRASSVDHVLALIRSAESSLEQADCIEDVLDLRDRATAIAALARLTEAQFEVEQLATMLRLKTERKAGEWLSNHVQHGGATSRASMLPDLGITPNQSSRWQAIASIPQPKFNAYLDEKVAAGFDLTAAGLIRYAHSLSPNGSAPGVFTANLNLNPTERSCALRGFSIACAGTLQGHHIITKEMAKGNDEARDLLRACPREIMANVCEAHHMGQYVNSPDARRIMLLQKVYAFGWSHMHDFINGLPWKVLTHDRTLEGMLR